MTHQRDQPALGNPLLASPKRDQSTLTGNQGLQIDVSVEPDPEPATEDDTCPEIRTVEPNKMALVNKIDRLQRTNARLMEKADFQRDHIAHLTAELQKKGNLLQVREFLSITE